jgi:hypothetical protein
MSWITVVNIFLALVIFATSLTIPNYDNYDERVVADQEEDEGEIELGLGVERGQRQFQFPSKICSIFIQICLIFFVTFIIVFIIDNNNRSGSIVESLSENRTKFSEIQ